MIVTVGSVCTSMNVIIICYVYTKSESFICLDFLALIHVHCLIMTAHITQLYIVY